MSSYFSVTNDTHRPTISVFYTILQKDCRHKSSYLRNQVGNNTRISSWLHTHIDSKHYFEEIKHSIKRKNTGWGNATSVLKILRNNACGLMQKQSLLDIRSTKLHRWAVLSSGLFYRTLRIMQWKFLCLRKGLESHHLTGKHDGEIGIEIFFHLVQFSRIIGFYFKTEHSKDISLNLWSFYLDAFR